MALNWINKTTGQQLTADEINAIANQAVESAIKSYSTEDLPGAAPDGTIAIDTTISAPVYFLSGRWLKVSDDTVVADRVVEIYILSGQSNAGGTADSANLSGYNQLDGDGTLADTRTNVLFSNNHSSSQSGTPGVLSPAGNHGIEVSLLDGLDNARTKKQFLVKYYSGGSSIDTWNKDESFRETGSGDRNNWDKLIQSIDHVISWSHNAGYTLDWKGFAWWQGESDREPDNAAAKAEYKTKLQTLIANVRDYVSKPELAVCLIEVDNRLADDANGLNSTSTSGMSEIQDAQAEVADADDYVQFIDVTKYGHLMAWSGPNSGGKYDGVHWQTEAYVNIGWDVAERMNDIIEGTLDYSPPSPVLWIDPSDESTVTYDNTSFRISQIADKSGNDYHGSMSNTEWQPKYNVNPLNGLKTMQGEPWRCVFSLLPNPADWQDTYVVARYDTINSSDNTWHDHIALFGGILNNSANIGVQGNKNTTSLWGGWWDTIHMNGTVTSNSGIPAQMVDPFLINISKSTNVSARGFCFGTDRFAFTTDRVTYNGTVYRALNNHDSVTTTPDLDTTNWVVETDNSYAGSDDWVSGSVYKLRRTTGMPNTYRGWRGPIGELLVFDRKLTDAERQEVEGYLAHKWGLAGRLPSDHPYKDSAP